MEISKISTAYRPSTGSSVPRHESAGSFSRSPASNGTMADSADVGMGRNRRFDQDHRTSMPRKFGAKRENTGSVDGGGLADFGNDVVHSAGDFGGAVLNAPLQAMERAEVWLRRHSEGIEHLGNATLGITAAGLAAYMGGPTAVLVHHFGGPPVHSVASPHFGASSDAVYDPRQNAWTALAVGACGGVTAALWRAGGLRNLGQAFGNAIAPTGHRPAMPVDAPPLVIPLIS